MFAPEDPTAINDIGEPPLGSRAGVPVWDYEACSFSSDTLSVSIGLLTSCPSLPSSGVGGSVTVVGASVDDDEFDGSVSIGALVPDPPPASVVVEESVSSEEAVVDGSAEVLSVDTFDCEGSGELSVLFVAAV